MIDVTVASPEKQIISSFKALHVTLSTAEGVLQILPSHKALVTSIILGPFLIEGQERQIKGIFESGHIYVHNDIVEIYVQTFVLKKELKLENIIQQLKFYQAQASQLGIDDEKKSFLTDQIKKLKMQKDLFTKKD